ncbi:MAG: DNA gyrase subunit A [Acholeplasmataceae bacterium]|jgi:DNA gyrase subunit A|nr:DNA gyrase subunit A [Acholeplasmataceae bacterium]
MEDIKKLDDIEEHDDFEGYNDEEHNHGKIKEINITSEMKTSFLSYAMSVIVSRALPDVRDGMKPVQRRIIYAMNDLGMYADRPHKKSARIVGEVIGKYHPHGDSSVYEAMVRMAQPFNYREPLVDGHGNFGSVDGDSAAAMRYTEARMSKMAMELVRDLDKNTVDFVDNYDNSEKEPSVLPARYPNLLVNGASGIAVGMATEIPPHNLGEVIDGTLAYIKNKDITISELMQHVKGPDFPTGGQILGLTGLREGYETGNGKIAIRATTEIVHYKNKSAIIITEIPYQVNKTRLIDKIAEIVKDKVVEGITDLRDESNRKGMRVVIELRKDVIPEVMLNNLYKYTQLQTSYSLNMIALVNGQPKTLNLKEMIAHYVDHQVEVIQRRTQYDLEKAEARQHILEGLIAALNDIDRAIEMIKESKTGDEAREKLIQAYELTDVQARAILDMRLQRLTGLEIEKIRAEHVELGMKIKEYHEVLASEGRKFEIIYEELLEIKQRFANPRLSQINLHADLSIENEDLIPVEDVIVTVTNQGYIKRMPVDEYKSQNRGGVGVTGMRVHDDDFVEQMGLTSTHDYHLFFTNKGRVYKIKGYEIPDLGRTAKGLPIVNLLNFDKDETLASFTSIKDFECEESYLFFTTKNGIVKRTPVTDFQNIRTNGIIAIALKEGDELLAVGVTNGQKDIILGSVSGKSIRFAESDVRPTGRNTSGVIGMRLEEDEYIVGGGVIPSNEHDILVISEKGFGKRTSVNEYRQQKRGGKGVLTLNVTERNGKLSALRVVTDNDDLIVISNRGIVIRTPISQISRTSRVTQGVKVIKLRPDNLVSTTAIVDHIDEDEEIVETVEFTQKQLELNNNQEVEIEVVELKPILDDEDEEKVVTKESIFDE